MNWDEAVAAARDARRTIETLQRNVASVADLLAGGLRFSGVQASVCRALKKELEKFDMRSGTWRQ